MARLKPGTLAGDALSAVLLVAVTFAIAGVELGVVTTAVAAGWLAVLYLPDRENRSDQGPPPGR